jgi:uncharacterized C2H2 Zn-finger protein
MKVKKIPIMTFQCEKCDKLFDREEHLTRHNDRKIPCNRVLSCDRCFKDFTHKSDLTKHMSRRFLCDNKKEELLLQLRIKDKELDVKKEELHIEETRLDVRKEDVKVKDKELQIEQEKTKQAKLEHKSTITVGNNSSANLLNIFGDNITNIYNINEVKSIKANSQHAAEKLIKTNNLDETLKQLVNLHFNNDDHPKNKCIAIKDGKIYSLIDDKVVEFRQARPEFNKIIKDTCESVEFDYGKYSDDEMYKYGTNQREEHLSENDSNTLKKISQYVGNHRNDGYVDNVIIVSLN